METNDTVDRMRRVMELSRSLGAPIDGIPGKAAELAGVIETYLRANATPKEALLVVAVVYLYFAAILMKHPEDGNTETAMNNAKAALDAAQAVMTYVSMNEDC